MNGPGDISLTHSSATSDIRPCGLISIIPTLGMSSCRGRAEAFARRLSSKLRILGAQNDGQAISQEDESIISESSENTWLTSRDNSKNIVTNSQPLRNESESVFNFDCEAESPGSPVDECEYLRLIETSSSTPHNTVIETGFGYISEENCLASTYGTKPSSANEGNEDVDQPDTGLIKTWKHNTSNDYESAEKCLSVHCHTSKIDIRVQSDLTADSYILNNVCLTQPELVTYPESTIIPQKDVMFNIQSATEQVSECENSDCLKSNAENSLYCKVGSGVENVTENVSLNIFLNNMTDSKVDLVATNESQPENINECIHFIEGNHSNKNIDESKAMYGNSNSGISLISNKLGTQSLTHLETVDYTDDEDDCRPQRVRRCSSLKSGKTPPGTPGRKKIVRFADVLGLDLADVKTFLDEIPTIPKSAFEDLEVLDSEPPIQIGPKSDKLLLPLFQQPGGLPTFLDLVREKQVSLENAVVTDHINQTVTGSVRVRNLDFHKSVHIRYTLDNWRSFADLQGNYVDNSCDGFSDKFTFILFGNTLQIGQRLEFAVRFQCKGQQFWDNNYGANYCFQCLATSNSSPIREKSMDTSHHHNNDIEIFSPSAGDAWCSSFY